MFKYVLVIALALFVVAQSKPALGELDTYTFEKYVKEYNKPHAAASHPEHFYRKMIFENNMRKIRAHNALKTSSFKMGVNKFTDLTKEEMRRFKGLKKNKQVPHYPKSQILDETKYRIQAKDLPDSFDWTTHDGVVTPVKNQ